MGKRDEMFRAKALIFMIPLVLPIGQPPARAVDLREPDVVECLPAQSLNTPEDAALLDGTTDLPDTLRPDRD